MVARGIEYVELYATDEKSTIDYFVASLGFARIAESIEPDRRSVLLRQGDTQIVVTGGPRTEAFLDAHGDGIADVALACDDVAATRDAALAAGASMVGSTSRDPVVTGFGDVTHTLVTAGAGGSRRPPGGREWSAVRGAGQPPARIRLLDHVAICLEGGTLDRWADFYRDAFGLARFSSEFIDVGDNSMDSIVVRGESGGVTFTLVAPGGAGGQGQLDAFLGRNGGPGVQHLAFLVDDIVAAVHEASARGVEFLRTPAAYYDALVERVSGMPEKIADLRAANVLADRDEWGYLLQLFTRSPHERNTLFYEFIQRRGSRGFGSANIRALYEAVERDRLAAE